jgi:putative DNA primase/helicase
VAFDPAPEFNIPDISGTPVSEDMAARLFVEAYQGRLAYCHDRGKWYEFNGAIWHIHRTPAVLHYSREFCRYLSVFASNGPALQKLKMFQAVESMARSTPAFSRTSTDWDRNPMLLGTPGGTVDLKTGELRQSKSGENITKSVVCAPDPFEDCRRWHEFMEQITGGDEGLIRFLQQISGYCLTGLTTEQALFFIYGTGGNGKGVFINILQYIINDYSQTANMEMLERQKNTSHRTELASLVGARLVAASETTEGGEWNDKRLKAMTGGDRIKANFMRQDEFEYSPEFKLVIAGNHEPSLQSVDKAMKRRFNIIPMNITPAKPDGDLTERLKMEAPGILRWMINGCTDWQENGLIRPPVVLKATEAYFRDQNVMQQWIDEACTVEPNNDHLCERSGAMFASWQKYAIAHGLKPGTSKTFKPAMLGLGHPQVERRDANYYVCMCLRSSLNREHDD